MTGWTRLLRAGEGAVATAFLATAYAQNPAKLAGRVQTVDIVLLDEAGAGLVRERYALMQ